MEEAAETLKLTAQDLLEIGLIDGIIPEPRGGAHRDPEKTAANIKKSIMKNLDELTDMPPEELIKTRYEKYRRIGNFEKR